MHPTYDEHLKFLEQQVEGAKAELQGFISSKSRRAHMDPCDPYLRQRYEQGYRDGRAKLECA